MRSAYPMPRVSAVIPTRNRPDLLQRAVLSVLQQSIADVEAVVVIDGPDPETLSMLSTIHDERLRVVALSESVGGSEARNIGVEQARGTWIGLLDDDDEWMPLKCARQIELAERSGDDSSLLIVSKFIARSPTEPDRVQPIRLPTKGEPLSEYMFSPRCGFQTSTFFCRRDLLLRIPFARGLKGCQDLDWFLRMVADPCVRLAICEDPLAIFHVPIARQSVSRGLDWRFRLDWGKARKALMTRRAYSLCIVQVVGTKAIEQPFSIKIMLTSLRECIAGGSADGRIVAHLLALFVLSPQTRQKLREFSQRSRQQAAINPVPLGNLAQPK
jgi:glycosyltransferase involved in cell wall biosynthesis